MKTVEIIGYKRASLGKKEARSIRKQGSVPCVLYGIGEQAHFSVPMILFRDLVYTNEAHFVQLNIEGEQCRAILQEIQFHPVSEIILHADFLRISDDHKIKMDIPIRLDGQALGVLKGGTLVHKKPYLKVYGYPKDMPEHISLDVSKLDFHNSLKVADVPKGKLKYIDPMIASVAVIEVPRAAKMEEEEAAAESTTETATPDNAEETNKSDASKAEG